MRASPASCRSRKSGADSLNAYWRYLFEGDRGRLHITLNHVLTAPKNEEVLRLQLVARGPLTSNEPGELRSCLNMGHEAIVKNFAAITSGAAHKHWKRIS